MKHYRVKESPEQDASVFQAAIIINTEELFASTDVAGTLGKHALESAFAMYEAWLQAKSLLEETPVEGV